MLFSKVTTYFVLFCFYISTETSTYWWAAAVPDASVSRYTSQRLCREVIHRSTASRILSTRTNFLYCLLGSKRLWIPSEVVRAHLPPEFSAFADTQVVLDCTEIFSQIPSSLLLQSEVFSNYIAHATFKAMIGMAPQGAITFLSGLYVGSMSNREISTLSGITKLLSPDMAIMVDKDFPVDTIAGCKVNRPAFLA